MATAPASPQALSGSGSWAAETISSLPFPRSSCEHTSSGFPLPSAAQRPTGQPPPGRPLPGDCPCKKPDSHTGLLAQAFVRAPEVLEREGERGLDRGAIGQDELAVHAGPQRHCRAEVQAELLLVAWLWAGNTAPCPWAPGYTPPLALPSEPPWEGPRALSGKQSSPSDSHLIKLPPRRHPLLVNLGCQREASNFTSSPWPGAD